MACGPKIEETVPDRQTWAASDMIRPTKASSKNTVGLAAKNDG